MTHDHLMTHLEHMLPSSQRLAASLGAPLETTTTKDGHNPTAPPETPTGSPMGRRQRPPVSSCWCCAATTIKTSSLTRDSTTTTTFPIMCLCINVIVVVVVVFVALVVAVSSSSSGDPISSGRPVRIVTTTTTSLNETPAPMAVIAEALAASPITSSTANTSLITTTTTTSQLRPLPLVSPSKSSDTPPRHADHTQRRTPRRGLLLLPREPTASQSHPFEVKSSSLSPNVLAKRSNADYDDDTSSSSSSSSSSWPSSNSTSSSSSDDGPAGPASTRLIQDDSSSDAVLETSEDDDQILRDEIEFRRRLIDQSWQTTSSSSANLGQTSPSKVNQTTGARLHDQENNNNNADGASFVASFFSHIDKQWKFAEIVLIIVISAILNLVTIVGNIMVLISFKMDRSLQTVSNYFLLSLALADLLIGLISMPLYTLYLLLNYWPLGALMCDIWLAIDYLNSNAAVLNMLIISFDRYFSVTRPLTYRAKRTTKHAILMISFAWILSLTIWTPAIFTYPYYKGRTVQGTDKCEIEFVKANTYLTFVTAILAFYIPVAIMIYLYWRIWLETKKRYRDLTTLFLVSGVGAAAPSRPTRPPPSSLTSGSGPASTVVSSSTGAPTSGVGLYAASGRSLAKSLGARLGGGCGSGGPHEFMGTGRRRTSAGSVTTTTTGGGAPSAATANATKTGAPRDPRGPPASTTTTTSASSLPMPQRDNGHCRHESSPPTRPCGRSPDVEQQLQMKSNGDPGKPPSDGSASSQTVLPVTGFIGKLKAVDGLQSIGAGSKTTGEQPIAKCATDSQCGCPVACSTTGHTKSSTSPSLSAAAHQHPSMSAKSVCRLCQQQEGPAHCVGSIGKRNKSASRANCCCCYSSAPAKTTTSSSLSSALASQIQKNRAGGSSSKNCCYCSSSTCSCCCGNVNYQAGARTATATTKTTTLNAPKQPVQDAMKPASKSNQIAYQDFETDEQKQPVTTGASNSNNVKCQKSGSKSSLYQLIADAASSSHQRSKIHPTATSEQQLASSNHRHRTRPGDDEDDDGNSSGTDDDDDDDDDDQEEEEDDDEDEKDEVANRKLKDPDQQDSTELKGEQPTKSRRECLLVDVATSPINFPAAAAFGEEKQQQQRQRHGINLDRLGQASVPVAPPPVSPLSPEREDFETRIVSYGDKFTFETNDPKLVGQAALGGPGATGSGTGTGAGGSGQSGSKQRCCRSHGHHSGHRHNHQQGAPATSRSGSNAHHNRHHHHHHHHLPPSGAGRQASGCHCADVISAHDAECRFCGPSGKPEQPQQRLVNHQNQNSAHHHHTQTHTHHPYHHHHHHHHNHHGQKHHHHHHHNHHHHNQHHLAATRQSHRLTDCKRCFQQQQQQRPPPPSPVPNKMLAPSSGGHEAGQGSNNKKLYKQNIKQEQALAGLAVVGPITKVSAAPASDHGGSLPILNALQQQQKHQASESGGLPGPPGNRSTRSGKKFSQKLTFSDILIERSNSCVTIESDHQQQQQGASSAKSSVNGDGGVRSSKKGAAGPASGASQDIVKRNADRLRSAFDDDELDEDNDDQELTSGRAKPAPQSLAGQSWLKCLFMDMFQSRNRPVRYKTNYRGPGATNDDQPTDHQRESARRARWIDSLCCSRAQTSGPILKCSSPRTSDELSAYQRDQPTDSSTNSMNEQQQQQHHHQHQHHQQKGGTSSQHSSTSSSKAQQCHHYHPIQPKSERKAAKTLSTLLLVFIVTWLPYNVLVLIKTLSGGEDQVPEKIWNFSYYLCYINSTINPLCYALCNAQFRRTYMRILKCKLSNEHNSTRRLVPIQSSSTWNKDLKLNSTTSPNTDCSGTNSNTSHQHQHGQHLQVHLQQVARTAERTRPRAGQARKNTSSSDSSTGNHRLR